MSANLMRSNFEHVPSLWKSAFPNTNPLIPVRFVAYLSTIFLACIAFTSPALAQGEEVTVMLPGDVPMTLVRVPAGTFMMGSPEGERGNDIFDNERLHQVTLTQDYYIGKTEVTQRQWQAVMGTPNPDRCNNFATGDNYPAGCLTWYEIAGEGGFVEKLNEVMDSQAFRLPTEAEWERAARAGTQTRFSHGDVLECSDDCSACAEHNQYMWWCGNSQDAAHPVGTKLANQYGLHDMHGNQWEFVQDRYGNFTSNDVIDPTGPSIGNDRVLRGGDWGGDALFSRSASRVGANPGDPGTGADMSPSSGFRIAASDLEGLAFAMDAGLNGNWWYGPDRSGEGFQIEISEGPGGSLTFVVTFYSYSPSGGQIFMIAVGEVNGDTAEVDVFITDGAMWGDDFDPQDVNETQWGTGVFTASSCEHIHMELYPNAEYQTLGYTDLAYDLVRLTTPLIQCPLPN
jgi:formylglycine-generating enzyme required for sulfatase activity